MSRLSVRSVADRLRFTVTTASDRPINTPLIFSWSCSSVAHSGERERRCVYKTGKSRAALAARQHSWGVFINTVALSCPLSSSCRPVVLTLRSELSVPSQWKRRFTRGEFRPAGSFTQELRGVQTQSRNNWVGINFGRVNMNTHQWNRK